MTTQDEYASAFAQQLRVEMADRGMQQSELAVSIGVRPETMSRYMTGKLDFKMGQIHAIAEVLGLTIKELFERTEARLKR